MKKFCFYALATVTLVGCTSDELLTDVDNSSNKSEEPQAITFGSSTPNLTRGTSVGSDAATKLGGKFVVYGTKHDAAEDETADHDDLVYDMYQVSYSDNSAYTTESNTNNWEYVGNTAYSAAVTTAQTVKYWDYATTGYTFYAFASNQISYPADAANDLVVVTKTTTGTNNKYEKGFEVTLKSGAQMENIFYADRVDVAKANYGDPVTLTFRCMGSQIRVGFYETVPGYSVKINKFYYDADATADVTTFAAMDTEDATNFEAAVQNIGIPAGSTNTMYVKYYDDTDASTENRAIVSGATVGYQYNLQLGTGVLNTELGTSSSSCTWDNAGGGYNSITPNTGATNPMLIRCDYTLTSTDGSNEVIKVKNARVVVPVQYVQWKSNYAYTYIFKISDKTNGTTGTIPTDPDDPTSGDVEGLYPITFDACVVATENGYEQETLSTVASNSVTTYQNGKAITANNEYRPGDIYVVNSDISTHNVIAPTGIGTDANKAQVYKITSTGDGISEATVLANLTGSPNGLTLTAVSTTSCTSIPAADGSSYTLSGVQFTGEASTYYAYVYCNTEYVAPTYDAASGDYTAGTIYYLKTTNDVYYRASGISAENFNKYKSQLYVQTNAGIAGSYDVKVIRVRAAGEEAQNYTYADYTYKAKSIKTEGNTVTFTYETANYTGQNVLYDLARFLGALYRESNVQEITENFTSGSAITYAWDEASAGNLKGSNWYDAANSKTLVSAITTWYAANPTATEIVLNLDGVATTFKFVLE